MLNKNIKKLVQYGLKTELIKQEDEIYTRNLLLGLFHQDEYEDDGVEHEDTPLEDILKELLDYAYENGLMKEE